MSVLHMARRMVDQQPAHRVFSLYLDLDPEEFAAPPARASQISSLIDEAAKRVESERSELDHEELMALREDLDRVRNYLLSEARRGVALPPLALSALRPLGPWRTERGADAPTR